MDDDANTRRITMALTTMMATILMILMMTTRSIEWWQRRRLLRSIPVHASNSKARTQRPVHDTTEMTGPNTAASLRHVSLTACDGRIAETHTHTDSSMHACHYRCYRHHQHHQYQPSSSRPTVQTCLTAARTNRGIVSSNTRLDASNDKAQRLPPTHPTAF